MSYSVQFRGPDAPALTVSNERGEKLKELWFGGSKTTPIDIDGDAYLIGDIKRITKSPDPIAPPSFEQRELPSGPNCRGQYSIQREINDIAKSDHPTNWAKYITDRKWREKTRLELRAQKGVVWCDYREGECACE